MHAPYTHADAKTTNTHNRLTADAGAHLKLLEVRGLQHLPLPDLGLHLDRVGLELRNLLR